MAAQVLDVSTSGIRVTVDTYLVAGSEVTVYFNNTIATGQIRYCRSKRDGSFYAGIQIEDVLNTV